MNSNQLINNAPAVQDYLSRKIFGVPFSQLPLVDRPTLAALTPADNILPAGVTRVPSAESAKDAMWRLLYYQMGW